MSKILVVDDDSALARRIQTLLTFEQHTVETVGNGTEALQQLLITKYDVIILDLLLPGLNGVEVCREFRARGGTTPIIMLTGKTEVPQKITGLDAGADDYLTKPFHADELMARVRALLRRSSGVLGEVLKAGNLTLEHRSHRVTKNGAEIELSPKEFLLLEFFMRNPNTVFSAEAILDRVWQSDAETSSHTIRTHILRLRGKIDTAGQPSMIQTIAGVGYKLSIM
jgi:DNA-binding response OmpR family regulator